MRFVTSIVIVSIIQSAQNQTQTRPLLFAVHRKRRFALSAFIEAVLPV